MREIAVGVTFLLVAAISGCTGGGDDAGAGTPSPSLTAPPPSLVEVFNSQVDCLADRPTSPTGTKGEAFYVDTGYDQLIVSFHHSGEGYYNVEIKYNDNGTVIFEQSDNERAPPCGTHDKSHGGGIIIPIGLEGDGEYSVKMSWMGDVSMHLGVNAKNTTSTNTTSPTTSHNHSHAPAR